MSTNWVSKFGHNIEEQLVDKKNCKRRVVAWSVEYQVDFSTPGPLGAENGPLNLSANGPALSQFQSLEN